MNQDGRGFSAILEDVLRNFERMVRAEVRLAKSEFKEEIVKAKVASLLLASGAVFALCALVAGLLAAIDGLALIMPSWAAALVVSVACALVAALLAFTGISRLKNIDPIPDRAVDRPKEDLQWVSQHAK